MEDYFGRCTSCGRSCRCNEKVVARFDGGPNNGQTQVLPGLPPPEYRFAVCSTATMSSEAPDAAAPMHYVIYRRNQRNNDGSVRYVFWKDTRDDELIELRKKVKEAREALAA